ncbi:MAG: hypothetical protein ACJAUD_000777 [Crocinitomicaceae bacterium]|jgi:hypothetical protein
MIKRLLLSLIIIFCAAPAEAGKDKPDVGPMNVLFIGNSYTHMNKMPKIFEKIAQSRGVDINVEMSAESSHTFNMHSKREAMFQTIKSEKWDYVVLQGFSRELSESRSYIDTASVPYIGIILDSIYNNNPCTNVLLYMTWGYMNGFSEREELNSNESMSDSIRVGYEYISELFNLPIVPVGPVWRDFRASNNEIELYHSDSAHPSSYGSYMIACSFYSALFKELPEDAYTGSIGKDEAKLLQTSAYNYVMKNVDTFKLNQNMLSVSFERTEMGKYYATCKANYPNAESVTWDFGDGLSSKSSDIKHEYTKAGEYWITLTIKDFCGERKEKRMVKFDKPKCPSRKKKSKLKVVSDSTKKV